MPSDKALKRIIPFIYIWFAENGNIRKWDKKPFPGGVKYIAADPDAINSHYEGDYLPPLEASDDN